MDDNYEFINGKKYKKCAETQIRNPKTKRCVSKKGKIGLEIQLLLKKQHQESKKQESKKQEERKEEPKKQEISNKDCVKWLLNKNKNPLTGRAISEKGAIYKKLNKNCNVINEKAIKIQKFFLSKYKKLSSSKSKSSKVSPPKVSPPKVSPPKVSPQKTKIVKQNGKLDNTACIVKKGEDLIIDDKIKLIKKFGSSSSFGINFISSYIDDDSFRFSSKIQHNTKEAKKELYLLKVLSDIRKKTNNLNFPLLYNYTICPSNKVGNRDDLPDFFKANKRAGYIAMFNELLLGDLKNYLYNIAKSDYNLWLNAIEQIYMCLASLHSLGLTHNDSHYGNFLYKETEKGGYFHYKINGDDYYIPNLGYIWVIWDFGVSSIIYRHYDYIDDYNFLNLFLRYDNPKLLTENFKRKFPIDNKDANKKYRDYGFIDKSRILIPKEIELLVEELWNYSGRDSINTLSNLSKDKQTEDKWFKLLLSEHLLFNHKPSTNIVNSTVINFQHLTKEFDFLINKKAYQIDISKIEKMN